MIGYEENNHCSRDETAKGIVIEGRKFTSLGEDYQRVRK